MGNYSELLEAYKKLKEEFEGYQKFAEQTIQNISEKNTRLEKNLDALSSIVEISKYINSNISDENLISMINDMIIGILGVTYSSIYLKEEDKFIVKATNVPDEGCAFYNQDYFMSLDKFEPFVINSKDSLFSDRLGKVNIHSVIGVPVYIRDKFIGYIVVEQGLCDFFNQEHVKFISAIANQIGIALENNFLYNKVKESSIRDPLLRTYNRRHFFELVEGKIAQNPDKPFAIVMVDLDNFKKANDVYGHQFGDEVLIQTANLLQQNVGKTDIVARYGGEEIVLYIDNSDDHDEVFKKIDNIRIKISENIIKHGGSEKSITASFGISYYNGSFDKLHEVLKKADDMMYSAKSSGKNKVVSV